MRKQNNPLINNVKIRKSLEMRLIYVLTQSPGLLRENVKFQELKVAMASDKFSLKLKSFSWGFATKLSLVYNRLI